MWLLLDVAAPSGAKQEPGPRWEGFNYIVNRTMEPGTDTDGTTWLEKNVGGWQWQKVAKVHYRAAGNELQLAIARSALELPQGSHDLALDFKWADNIQRPGDIMDFYLSGSTAPAGRFRYRYATAPEHAKEPRTK